MHDPEFEVATTGERDRPGDEHFDGGFGGTERATPRPGGATSVNQPS
jgi:hypothetical protein